MNPIGTMTNFPQGFANGITVRGMPLTQMQPGQAFFLGNGPVLNPNAKAGSDGNRGTFLDPFATLNYAVNTGCTPGRGDIVFVLPLHRETISAATIAYLNCTGVAVIGLGSGANRPTFNFTTAATATIPVGAPNISIQNCLFTANFLDVASVFTGTVSSFTGVIAGTTLTASSVTGSIYVGATLNGTGVTANTVVLAQLTGTTNGAGTYQVSVDGTVASTTMTTNSADFSIDNCEFRDTSSVLNFLNVFTSSATDNSVNGLSLTRSTVYGLGVTANTATLALACAVDRLTVQNNHIVNAVAANGNLVYQATTTKVLTRVLISDNTFRLVGANAATGILLLTTATTNTGVIKNNTLNGARAYATAILVTASSGFIFVNNLYSVTADVSGAILPAAQS